MVRFAIIGAVVGVALILYALVDAAMSDASRARGVSKPVWVVIIVVLPVIGALLWFIIGKGRGPAPEVVKAPDDDPRFTGTRLSPEEIDAHVAELEARLHELDNEVFPGADSRESAADDNGAGAQGSESNAAESKGTEPKGAEPKNGTVTPEGDSKREQR